MPRFKTRKAHAHLCTVGFEPRERPASQKPLQLAQVAVRRRDLLQHRSTGLRFLRAAASSRRAIASPGFGWRPGDEVARRTARLRASRICLAAALSFSGLPSLPHSLSKRSSLSSTDSSRAGTKWPCRERVTRCQRATAQRRRSIGITLAGGVPCTSCSICSAQRSSALRGRRGDSAQPNTSRQTDEGSGTDLCTRCPAPRHAWPAAVDSRRASL